MLVPVSIQLFVPTVTVFIAYLVVAYGTPSNEVNGIVTPLIFIAILSYFISAMFSEIFGMGIETILCCYVADEEMFPPEKRFADGGLKSTLQKTAEEAAKKNAKVLFTKQIKVVDADFNSRSLNDFGLFA